MRVTTIPQCFIVSRRVAPLAAAIGGVALGGVNSAVFTAAAARALTVAYCGFARKKTGIASTNHQPATHFFSAFCFRIFLKLDTPLI